MWRCPLSGKLFKEPMYVRKHIENKHTERLPAAKAAPLGEKYRRYFVAEIPLTAAAAAGAAAGGVPEGRRRPRGRGGGDWDGFGGKGKGKGGGWDDGFGKGRGGRGRGGRGGWGGDWGGGDWPRRRPTGRRRPAPPRSGGRRGHRDLDAPDDDDLFS